MSKQFSAVELDTLKELFEVLLDLSEAENIEQVIIYPTPNGWAADITSRPLDGTEGQDRDNYSDNQDREFYTVEES